MDINIWNSGTKNGMPAMFRAWQKLDTGKLNINIVDRNNKYIKKLWTLTEGKHGYVRTLRTIVEINGKHVYLDATDRSVLSAESWLLPFDLIIKFQHQPEEYESIAPVVPFTYTLSWYRNDIIDVHRKVRQETVAGRNFSSSMFWAGTIGTNISQRTTVRNYLRKRKLSDWKRAKFRRFYKKLATTQVGVVVAGTGDFTHREMELASIGTPYFRKTFTNITRNPRIPGVHYYSYGKATTSINKVLDYYCKYFEPKGKLRKFTKEEWDEYCEIGNNSLKWYEENGSAQGTFNLFLEILEEQNII